MSATHPPSAWIIMTGTSARVARPRFGRAENAAAGRRGAAGVDAGPHAQPFRAPARAPPLPVEGRVRECRREHRPEVVRAVPAPVELRDRAGVEVHLSRGRVAHHRATGGPPCVEVALHRAVAGEVDHPVAWSGGVEADAAELDAVGRERLSRCGGVALHARDGARDAELGWAAQLELAAWLEGQEAARGEGIGEV